MKEKLRNENQFVALYHDDENCLCILEKELNRTFRIVPSVGNMGFYLECFIDGKLRARTSVSVHDLSKILNKDQEKAPSEYIKCIHDVNGCHHPDQPAEAPKMQCHQQNCPWQQRHEDNTWWEEHPGRFVKNL
jgi:hypothetical protein